MKKYLTIVILIISIGCNLFLGNKAFWLGSSDEREKVLNATVWNLADGGYKKDDIEKVKVYYNPMSGGTKPYEVSVVFKKDPSIARWYSWIGNGVEKKEIEIQGTSAAQKK